MQPPGSVFPQTCGVPAGAACTEVQSELLLPGGDERVGRKVCGGEGGTGKDRGSQGPGTGAERRPGILHHQSAETADRGRGGGGAWGDCGRGGELEEV